MTFSRACSDITERLHIAIKARPEIVYLLSIALIIRLAYLVLMLTQLTGDQIMQLAPDTVRYVGLGKQILSLHITDESAILLFGPGYCAFLAILFGLFGAAPLPVLLVQIAFSSISCVLIYLLAVELTNSRPVATIAGLLSAFSFTSISLANFILSDSLFFFLFLLGNLSFLKGLRSGRKSSLILSGLYIGAAILTRSIGQLWPFAMVLLAFLLPGKGSAVGWSMGRQFRRRACLAPVIALIIVAAWAARNAHVHGISAPATSSAGGPANVAARTMAAIESRPVDEIRADWADQYQKDTGKLYLTYKDMYRLHLAAAFRIMAGHPREMVGTYFALVWENMNATNELYRYQLPAQRNDILDLMWKLSERSLQYLPFWLSMSGFCLMLLFRRWRALIMPATIYLYFAAMVGFSQWQGSRLFFPGQIAWVIAIAFLLVTVASAAKAAYRRMTGR